MTEERCKMCVYFKPYAFAPDKGDCLTHKNKRYETRSIDSCEHFTVKEEKEIMKTPNIDWKNQDKRPITTRDGRRVQIFLENNGKLFGVYYESNTHAHGADWFLDGLYYSGQETCLDLIQAPERKEYVLYANFYNCGGAPMLSPHNDEGVAKEYGGGRATATAVPITVTIDGNRIFIHGEGEINKGVNI